MFEYKFPCIGKTHWSQKENKFLFEYAFEVEPQSGDEIELTPDELEEQEQVPHIKWRIIGRKFIRGKALVIVQPVEGTNGLVQA